jgi:hypothetical protein
MRVTKIGRNIVSICFASIVTPALSGCFLIGLTNPPCPDDQFEERTSAEGWCACQTGQFDIPKHICCRGPNCDEASEYPDPETSDPVGTLSLALDGPATETPPIVEACDGNELPIPVKWNYINLVNGAVGGWGDYQALEPKLTVNHNDAVGGVVFTAPGGWNSMPAGGIDMHSQNAGLEPGEYAISIFPLLDRVQGANNAAALKIYDLIPGDPWYDTRCGTGGSGN